MRILIFCVSAFAFSLRLAADEPARLEFKTNGFSIEAMEETSEATVQVLVMTLPATEEFAPNINVQVQPYAGTIEEYMTLSKTQLKQVNFTEIRTEIKEGRCILEFTGNTQDRDLHFYSVAKKRNGKIILATATALQTQWPAVSKKLIRCADSLKIDEAN